MNATHIERKSEYPKASGASGILGTIILHYEKEVRKTWDIWEKVNKGKYAFSVDAENN